jgi:hypothetical protein
MFGRRWHAFCEALQTRRFERSYRMALTFAILPNPYFFPPDISKFHRLKINLGFIPSKQNSTQTSTNQYGYVFRYFLDHLLTNILAASVV